MQLQVVSNDVYSIHSYFNNPPKVCIQQKEYTKTIALYEDNIHSLDITDTKQLQTEHLNLLLKYKPEILIIGTGEIQQFISPSLYKDYIKNRIGIECMTNSAACRTYNILLSEHRKTALILII